MSRALDLTTNSPPKASLYERLVLPRVVDFVCSMSVTSRQREKIVHRASGTVLEIGFGSGLNLPYYDQESVEQLIALEPSSSMLDLARPAIDSSPLVIEEIQAGAESIPLPDNSVDTVILTYTLCTIPEPDRALRELARVLRPEGQLLFCEHGLAPDPRVARWQHRLNSTWRRFAGGCELIRNTPAMLQAEGFQVIELEEAFIPGWRPASFNTWGLAQLNR